MSQRIGDKLFYDFQLKRIQEKQADIQEEQSRIASGKRILKGSDDPLGMVKSSELKSLNDAFTQYKRNMTISKQRLQLADTVLGSTGNILQRLKQLALRANSGAMGGVAAKALAKEVFEQAEGLIDLGNTLDSTGEYLFAGYRSHKKPFVRDADGFVRYKGDDGRRTIPISGSTEVRTSDTGNDIFMGIPTKTGHVNIFDVADRLNGLISALKQVYEESNEVTRNELPNMTDNISINGIKLDTDIEIPRITTGNREALVSFSGATQPGDLEYLTFTLGKTTHKIGPLGLSDKANVESMAQVLNSDPKFKGAKMKAEVTANGQLQITQVSGVPIENMNFTLKDQPRSLTVKLPDKNTTYGNVKKVSIKVGDETKHFEISPAMTPNSSAEDIVKRLNKNLEFSNAGLSAEYERVNGEDRVIIKSRAGRLHSADSGIYFTKKDDSTLKTETQQNRDTTLRPDVVLQYAGTRERTNLEKKMYMLNYISDETGVKVNIRGNKLTFTSKSGEPIRIDGNKGVLTKFGLGDADTKFLVLSKTSGANISSKARADRMKPLLTQLDEAIDHVLVYRMRVGARMRKLDIQSAVIQSQTTANKSALSTIEDVDVAKAATRLQQNKVLVQAAMQSLTMVQKLNLFEYMR